MSSPLSAGAPQDEPSPQAGPPHGPQHAAPSIQPQHSHARAMPSHARAMPQLQPVPRARQYGGAAPAIVLQIS